MISSTYGNGRQETHWQPTVIRVIKPKMSTNTNTNNDENTPLPANNRKGKEDLLLSTKSNMANTSFNDENTLCLPYNNAERMKHVTMVIARKRVTMEIDREIYNKAVFAGVDAHCRSSEKHP